MPPPPPAFKRGIQTARDDIGKVKRRVSLRTKGDDDGDRYKASRFARSGQQRRMGKYTSQNQICRRRRTARRTTTRMRKRKVPPSHMPLPLPPPLPPPGVASAVPTAEADANGAPRAWRTPPTMSAQIAKR